jgi:hypothetical protein
MTKFQKIIENVYFGHYDIAIFEFVLNFACLREAAPAKAGISCFEFQAYVT